MHFTMSARCNFSNRRTSSFAGSKAHHSGRLTLGSGSWFMVRHSMVWFRVRYRVWGSKGVVIRKAQSGRNNLPIHHLNVTHKRGTEGKGRLIKGRQRANKASLGAAPNSARKQQKCDRSDFTDSGRVRFFGTKAAGSWRDASMTTGAGKSERDME